MPQQGLCNESMSIETAEHIIDFIKRQYTKHPYRGKLQITWFGGEPLLNMPVIRHISNELKSQDIEFVAEIFTNGRLLTKDLAIELKELGIIRVVISVDGLADTYAKLRNCKETDFYTVIQNIKDCENILNIEVKINVTDANLDDAHKLYKVLREDYHLKSKIIHIGVFSINPDTRSGENSINNESLREFKEMDFQNEGMINGLGGCPTRNPNYYAIGVHGEAYICAHMVNKKDFILGNIKELDEQLNRTGTIWDIDSRIEKCKDCLAVPLCLGGCATVRYSYGNTDCDSDFILEHIAEKIRKAILNKFEQQTTLQTVKTT